MMTIDDLIRALETARASATLGGGTIVHFEPVLWNQGPEVPAFPIETVDVEAGGCVVLRN